MLASDRDVLADMKTQVSRLQDMPAQSTNVIVSCGGNDVIGLVGYMQSSVKVVIEAAELLAPNFGSSIGACSMAYRLKVCQ